MTTEIEHGSVWVRDGRPHFAYEHRTGLYSLMPERGLVPASWFATARCIFRPSDEGKKQNTVRLRAAVGHCVEDRDRYYIYGCNDKSDDKLVAGIYGWGCTHVGWIEADFPIPERPTVEGVVK